MTSKSRRQYFNMVQLIESNNTTIENVLSYIHHPDFVELVELSQKSKFNDDFQVAMAAVFSEHIISVSELKPRQFIDYSSACVSLLMNYKIKLKSEISMDASDKLNNKPRSNEDNLLPNKIEEVRNHVQSLSRVQISGKQKKRAGEQLLVLSIINAILKNAPLSLVSVYTNEIIDYKFEWKCLNDYVSFNTRLYVDELYCLETLTFLISHLNSSNLYLFNVIFDVLGPWFSRFIDKTQLIASTYNVKFLNRSLNREVSRRSKKSSSSANSYSITRSNSEISLYNLNVLSASNFFNSYVAIVLLFLKAYKSIIVNTPEIVKIKLFRFLLHFVCFINSDTLENAHLFNITHSDFIILNELLIYSLDSQTLKSMLFDEYPLISMNLVVNLCQLQIYLKRNNLIILNDSNMDPILDLVHIHTYQHLDFILNFKFPLSIQELQSKIYIPYMSYCQIIHDIVPDAYYNSFFSLIIDFNEHMFSNHLKLLKHHQFRFQDHKLITTLLLLILQQEVDVGPIVCFVEVIRNVQLLNGSKLIQLLTINTSPVYYCLLMQLIRQVHSQGNKRKSIFAPFLMTALGYKHANVSWNSIATIYKKHNIDIGYITSASNTLQHYIETISICFTAIDKDKLQAILPIILGLLKTNPCVELINLFYNLFEKYPKPLLRATSQSLYDHEMAYLFFHFRNYLQIKLKIRNISFIPLELGTFQQQSLPNYMQILKQEYTTLNTAPIPNNDKFISLDFLNLFSTVNKPIPHFIGLLFLKLENIPILSAIAVQDPLFLVKTAFIEVKHDNISLILNKIILRDPSNMQQLANICINYTLGLLRKLKTPSTDVLLQMNQLLSTCLLINPIDFKDLIKHKTNVFITPDEPVDVLLDIESSALSAIKLLNLFYMHQPIPVTPITPHIDYKMFYDSSLLLYQSHFLNANSIPLICSVHSTDLYVNRVVDAFILFINMKYYIHQEYLESVIIYMIKYHAKQHAVYYLQYTCYHLYQIHGDVFIMACLSATCKVINSIDPVGIVDFYNMFFESLTMEHPLHVQDSMALILNCLFDYYTIQIIPLEDVKEAFTKELLLKLIINILCEGYDGVLMKLYLLLMDDDSSGYVQMAQSSHLIKYNNELLVILLESDLIYLLTCNDVNVMLKLYLRHETNKINLHGFISNIKTYHQVYFSDDFIYAIATTISQNIRNINIVHEFIYNLTNAIDDQSLFKPLSEACQLHSVLAYNPCLEYIPVNIDYSFKGLINVLLPCSISHSNLGFITKGYVSEVVNHLQLSYKLSRLTMPITEYEKYYIFILAVILGNLINTNAALVEMLMNELMDNSNNNNIDALVVARHYVISCGCIYGIKMDSIYPKECYKKNRITAHGVLLQSKYKIVNGCRGLRICKCDYTKKEIMLKMIEFIIEEFRQPHLLNIPDYILPIRSPGFLDNQEFTPRNW
eukprot:NODE_268_length_12243_cov_0.338109.p1 type:complete len:1430 gc:universal NODE_268_length_12243_cov_0.338109:3802-8091(+)